MSHRRPVLRANDICVPSEDIVGNEILPYPAGVMLVGSITTPALVTRSLTSAATPQRTRIVETAIMTTPICFLNRQTNFVPGTVAKCPIFTSFPERPGAGLGEFCQKSASSSKVSQNHYLA